MASELSKFIEDELLREGNTGERSQLLNGGTFNVEKPRQRQAGSSIFTKRNIACVIILALIAVVVGTAFYHKDRATSKGTGLKHGKHGSKSTKSRPASGVPRGKPGSNMSAGPDELLADAPLAMSPASSAALIAAPEPAPAPAPTTALAPAPAIAAAPALGPVLTPIPAPDDSPGGAPSGDQLEPAIAPGPQPELSPNQLLGPEGAPIAEIPAPSPAPAVTVPRKHFFGRKLRDYY